MKTDTQTFIKRSAVTCSAIAAAISAHASTDYGPAIWRPACSTHHYTGYTARQVYVLHDMEGYYASTISYLQGCNNSVSVHYCVNGKQDATSDMPAGEITQMVLDSDSAWTAGCWNRYAEQTEHEGFVSNPAWYTEAMYQASSALTLSKANKYGIAKDRNHIIGHNQKTVAGWSAWAAANVSFDPNCNTHTDPGPYWNWAHYMDLLNPPPPQTMHDVGNRIVFNTATSKGYELDAFGGITRINGATAVTGNSYWSGWDIARDFGITSWTTPKGYTLDAFGALHPFGGQADVTGYSFYQPGWDIARAMEVNVSTGKGYVLDGLGGVHPFNGATAITSGPYWANWDIARDLVITDYATGKGYVLDGLGGINPLNGAPAVSSSAYWPNWDIARALVINPTTLKGYVLDGLGALHPVNGAPVPSGVSGFTFDIARDVVITDWTTPKGYTLDGYGAWHPFGGAPAVTGAPWFYW